MAVNQISHNDVKTNRHKYIGGSDIAVIMGMSRYKTPMRLWAEKTQKLQAPDLSNVEAVEMGTKLEQFVADLFSEKTGKAVRRSLKVYVHPQYDYMVAHIDRLVTGTDELLECKTCSAYKADEWDFEIEEIELEDGTKKKIQVPKIPQEYILQVMWYLGITGRKTGHIAVLIGGQRFRSRDIEFDQELFDQMVESAKEFWEHVQNNTPVALMPEDDETLKDLYAEANNNIIELYPVDEQTTSATNDFETNVAYLQELKAHKAELDKEIKEKENLIKDIIKDSQGIKTPKYVITWKNQVKESIDSKTLKANEPEIYENYKKVSTYRVLRINNNKESEV